MKRLFPLALLALTLEGCPSREDVATASAVPGYNLLAQAVLARNTQRPFTEVEKAAAKKADDAAFTLTIRLNGEQLQHAVDLHNSIQAL